MQCRYLLPGTTFKVSTVEPVWVYPTLMLWLGSDPVGRCRQGTIVARVSEEQRRTFTALICARGAYFIIDPTTLLMGWIYDTACIEPVLQ